MTVATATKYADQPSTRKQPVMFAGLEHYVFGDATIGVRHGALHVSGLGENHRSGLRVDVGAVRGFIPELDLPGPDAPIGGVMVSSTRGRVDGKLDQLTGSLSFERARKGIRLTPDFTSIGARSYELQLFRDGALVHRQPGMSGPAGVALNVLGARGKACCRVLVYSANFLTATPFVVNGGPEVLADTAYFVRENPTKRVDFISSVVTTAQGIKEARFHGEEVAVAEPFVGYQALGATQLNATPAWLEMTAFGNSGDDGVLIDWKKARSWSLGLGNLHDQLEANGSLTLASSGAAAGRSDHPLTTMTLKRVDTALQLAYDFSPLGATCASMEVRCKGETVAYRRAITDIRAVIDIQQGDFSPRVSHSLTGGSRQAPIAAALAWFKPLAIGLADDETVTGDELIVYAEGATIDSSVSSLGTVRLQAAQARGLTVVDQSVQRVNSVGPILVSP